MLPIARRVCGNADDATLGLRLAVPQSIVRNPDATKEELRGAMEELEDLFRVTRRVFGDQHPHYRFIRIQLEKTNIRLSTEF